MKNIRSAAVLLAIALAAMRASAELTATPEQKVTAFLLGTAESDTGKSELFYYYGKDKFMTRITFLPEKEFTRSDGIHGTWAFEGGKLILTVLDTDGFTMIFDPATLRDNQLTGYLSKGKRKGQVILKRTAK